MSLQAQIHELARTFTTAVVGAVRGASLQDIMAEVGVSTRRPAAARSTGRRSAARAAASAGKPKGRLARRSAGDIANTLAKVVGLLKGKKSGLRAEQIRGALRLDRREMPRVLREGIAKKALRSKGAKRATTYFTR